MKKYILIEVKKEKHHITRSLPINSKILGVSGECDVVEFHLDKNGVKIHGREYKYLPLPIEYKKRKPKIDDVDILQLTAQAICLEEMFCCTIKHGYLFYGNTKRREKIIFTQELRDKVQKSFDEMHKYYKRGYIPKVKISKM